MRAALLACAAALPWPEAARAQPLPPRVEVRRVTDKKLPPLVAGMVGVGDCFVTLALREVTEVADVEVVLVGPWERSAEHVAKQAAADAGANCLLPRQGYGPEDENYPVVRQYRSFLVTTVVSGAMGTFRLPAPARAFRPPETAAPNAPAPAAPAPAPAAAAAVEAPTVSHGPVWFERAYLESHDIVLDLSRMSEEEWEAVRRDVALYFPLAASEALRRARVVGGVVAIDLRRREVSRRDEPGAPEPRAGRAVVERLP
ncbi:MAG: hypothetical protein SF051_12360 [Elusimicrobiota bacterium]|nr:hypothetical protein [Elusimicrobiota bacterium]